MQLSIYSSLYAIHVPKYWKLNDRPSLHQAEEENDHAGLVFHIRQNDYFSNLATILKFFEESLNSPDANPDMRQLKLKTIKGVIQDLLYLDKNYAIFPKNKKIKAADK